MEYPFPVDGMYQRFSTLMLHVLHVLHVIVDVLHVLHMVVCRRSLVSSIDNCIFPGVGSGGFFFLTIFVIFFNKNFGKLLDKCVFIVQIIQLKFANFGKHFPIFQYQKIWKKRPY
jgi:hypothetical protein